MAKDRSAAHARRKAWVAEQFLHSAWLNRVLLLARAKHPWITMQFVSLFRSHTVRASLIILKLVSAAAANALFFISTATTPDSDPDCAPPQDFGERMLRAGIVGILSACMGDILIVFLAVVQRRSVVVRETWTREAKDRQLRKWLFRSYLFWFLWLLGAQVVRRKISSPVLCYARAVVSAAQSEFFSEAGKCRHLRRVRCWFPGQCKQGGWRQVDG